MLKKTTYCPYQPDSVPGDRDLDQGLRCGSGCSTLGVCWSDFLCWNQRIFQTGDYMFLALNFFFPSQLCTNTLKQDAELAQTNLFKSGNMSTWTQLLALSQGKSAPCLPEHSAIAMPEGRPELGYTHFYFHLDCGYRLQKGTVMSYMYGHAG